MQWETVIGLEVHSQLATQSKIFSGAATVFGAEPNSQACSVDLGLPGVLPVLNCEVVTMAVQFGTAIDAELGFRSVFARKNYFYPDLPKGYQISQFELPIVGRGDVDIELEDGTIKRVGVTRAHLEEDAGKSLHEDFQGCTGVDLNRAGTPLLEIVSEPDMRSAKEAVAYARKIHQIVQYLGICDGNMQEGSFRFLEKAINYEVERQIDVIDGGGKVVQETRLYDADKNETRSMRSKEEANDYRYFPDPDLLPVEFDQAFVDEVTKNLPEMPDAKRQRLIEQYGLKVTEAVTLISSRALADYYEATTESAGDAKLAANWVLGDLSGAINKNNIAISAVPVSPVMLGGMIKRIIDNTISGKIAKQVFEAMWLGEGDADAIIEAKGLKQITDTGAIEKIVDEVIAANPNQAGQFRAGKEKMLGFFVGQVMKQSKGKANPQQVNELLRSKLS